MNVELILEKRTPSAMSYLFAPYDPETECPRCFSRFKSALGVNIHWNKKHKKKTQRTQRLKKHNPKIIPLGYWDDPGYRIKTWKRYNRRVTRPIVAAYTWSMLPEALAMIEGTQ
jgi:uncharacterized C2H2 Zn-finger protein